MKSFKRHLYTRIQTNDPIAMKRFRRGILFPKGNGNLRKQRELEISSHDNLENNKDSMGEIENNGFGILETMADKVKWLEDRICIQETNYNRLETRLNTMDAVYVKAHLDYIETLLN